MKNIIVTGPPMTGKTTMVREILKNKKLVWTRTGWNGDSEKFAKAIHYFCKENYIFDLIVIDECNQNDIHLIEQLPDESNIFPYSGVAYTNYKRPLIIAISNAELQLNDNWDVVRVKLGYNYENLRELIKNKLND